MPTVSETASAFRNRFRFQELPSEISSPALFKSASKENVFLQSSAIRGSNGERDEQEISSRSSSVVHSFELQDDPSFWKDHNVQVVIRIRPLSNSEISLQGYNKCVRQDSCQTITWTGHPESRFTFDLIADENVTQENLFKVAGLPMVDNCMEGYNSCMFAYGQTGSGKTHTMLGDIEGGTRRHSVNCGMTPRVFEYLFSRIQKEKEARRDEKLRFTCKCSFLEIYNEQILDLLEPSSVNLQIREDAKKGVYVENLMEFEVSSARDVIQQLLQGATNRKVAATNMNHASSRSHSVFTCAIESKWEAQGVIHHRFARLNLVDLAGSERQKSSGAEGERLKEATNINKSLSTLGLVIMNLVSISNGKSQHVPYRDSKLTFLLQDSLGGNSKTTIIANISPSNCCALETLSTLKFAQRAKFIRNNAIINEDASGDVLAMRLQIQQLKKEVGRLRAMANGGTENDDTDNLSVCFPGSPGSFKWDALGSSSPLTCGKKPSQKKDLETALVGAFRREKEKEIALKALTDENQATIQLARQREEEIKGLKMRLRFREAGIKRLEGIVAGKIVPEAHVLQEKNELLKEIEVLRNQVDRNQEVTRFAMENLRLKEELRRLQSFYEDGERDLLYEQISVLQDKLLEALDWKLMHEKDSSILQKENLDPNSLFRSEDNLLISGQDPPLSWDSSATIEENEILRLQGIQNQKEVESLRKNLSFCLEAKEKLERRVDELVLQLEEERKITNSLKEAGRLETDGSISSGLNDLVEHSDQMELKTMVDAIAAASQREAEAHETAINLANENEELRTKLRVLIEDNNKLIELYENAVSEAKKDVGDVLQIRKTNQNLASTEFLVDHQENNILEPKNVEDLERQLQEMHEENEKLLGLYEKAMHERDEFKRVLWSNEQNNVEIKKEIYCPEKLVEVDEKGVYGNEEEESGNTETEIEPSKFAEVSEEELALARTKLDLAEDKLLHASKALIYFGFLEKFNFEFDRLSKEIITAEHDAQVKQQEISSLKVLHSEIQESKSKVDNKLRALKTAQSSFSASHLNWEQRENQARGRVDAFSFFVEKKKEELTGIQASREEIKIALSKTQQSESTVKNSISSLTLRLKDAENQRKETEKVLFVVDDSERSQHLGKAAELLKSEEERTKLAAERKRSKEQLASLQKEIDNLKLKLESSETKIKTIEAEIMTGLCSLEEAEFGLQNAIQEKESIAELREEGRKELGNLIIEYQQCTFELCLRKEELILCEEELEAVKIKIEGLSAAKKEAIEKKNQVLGENVWIYGELDSEYPFCVSEKVEEELGDVHRSVLEAKSLLVNNSI